MEEKDKKEEATDHPIIHTYQDDLSHAMNATEASVVQQLLATAREKEEDAKEEAIKTKQRGWYITGSIILLVLALSAAAYGVYHYRNLTVPISKSISVGVFPSTEAIVHTDIGIEELIQKFKTDPLPENKPLLVQLVDNKEALSIISNEALFNYIGATPTEPFKTSIDVLRLGVIRNGTNMQTFLIASTPDPETASKEFLIEEQKLYEMFFKALDGRKDIYNSEIGRQFQSDYVYNLPIRVLKTSNEDDGRVIILYGYATENIIVITRDPEVLKAVHDTIIRQHQ